MKPQLPRAAAAPPLAGLVLFLVASCGGAALTPVAQHGSPGSHVVAGGNGRRSAARLDVVSGATNVAVSSGSLGQLLYRVSTPAGSGIRPLVTLTGNRLEVGQTASGATTGVSTINVRLARGVRWAIDLNGGASTETVNMADSSLSSLTFGVGVSTASVRLPSPAGTLTVTLAGGATQLLVVAPEGPPAQVSARGGASQIFLDGIDHSGVAGGSVFSDPGWANARNRYAVDLVAGVSAFRMSRR